MVTFVEEYGIGARSKMIETKEDGSQQVKVIKMATATAIPSSSQLIMQYFLRKEAQ